MTKQDVQNIRIQIQSHLNRLNFLGFDYACQALHAVMTDADFESTWSLNDEPEFVSLVNQYKAVRS